MSQSPIIQYPITFNNSDNLDPIQLKATHEARYNMLRSCTQECHFQKQTLASEQINHTVYECLHLCASKYMKSYKVVSDTLHTYCNPQFSEDSNLDLSQFEAKSE